VGLFRVIYREIWRILGDTSGRNMMLFVPIITFFFLGGIYIKGALRDIPVAVFDQDHTLISRTLTRFIDASPLLKVQHMPSSEKSAEKILLNEEAYAVFYIPKGFSSELEKGKSSKLPVLINGSNILHGNIIYSAASTISMTLSGGALIKKLMENGMKFDEAKSMVLPIKVHIKPLYNPTYNYLYYLVPGLITVLFFMLIFFVATRSINHEVNLKTYTELYETANSNVLNIILGKAIGIYLLAMMVFLFIFGTVFIALGIPVQGSYFYIFIIFTFAIFANIFLGMALSSIFTEEPFAMDLAFFYNSPAFVFSGFTFPIFGMPSLNATYAQLLPYTFFLKAFIKAYQMNTPFRYFIPELQILGIFILVGLGVSIIGLAVRNKTYLTKSAIV
jgi:ABC-2 type transport system permease protein